MPGITDPSEEHFKGGLWAWVTDQWKKLVADASSFLQVNIAAQGIDVEIKQQTAADLTPGIKGWDGTQWRKLPMVWGYSDRYAESQHVADAPGVNVVMDLTAVPEGEVWVVEAISGIDVNNNPAYIEMSVCSAQVEIKLTHDTNPGANIWVTWTGRVTLKKDDYCCVYFNTVVVDDDLYARAWGYKLKIAE